MRTVVTVVASPHPRSRAAELDRAAADALRGAGLRVRRLPLELLPESALLAGRADAPALRWSRRLLEHADGIALITPTYEVSGSPLLRAWLDVVPPAGERPVQPVCLGSTQAQSGAADYAVRRLLTDRGARRVAPACFLFDRWLTAGDDGWEWDQRATARLTGALTAFADDLAGAPAAA
ncbi:NAD(P)H-dependent oxidoreductase [Saccharopolyspora sp. 6V]|uniref:NAD(P)H-dependent oxidoreductase n=1 Tax=Saccharopolyspora sp. 6V TaxID=2877239 RepID=UPI001CD5F472|nr:NAD(P)H-dependent oxidoreductase [Saccharopolyspora sp. 6V]MCA1192548.1 NAD(P)H-dependent oxidoreductase [Saccharopolyspora sp. 6V]